MFATCKASASTFLVALIGNLVCARRGIAATQRVRWFAALALVCSSLVVSVSAQTSNWGTAASMATARQSHTTTLLPSGKVLVAGGQNSGGGYVTSAELYDPATGAWSTAGNLSTARGFHTATLLPSGKVLVAGGYGSTGFLASAELYDPATGSTGTWSSAGNLTTARDQHTATLLPSGKVLVVGGYGNTGKISGAELYDPATGSTGTWGSAGNLSAARYIHAATLLPSGKVLVAGGGGNGGALTSAELYDPASSSWTTTGSLGAARYNHTATLLPSGKVLVTGGRTSTVLSPGPSCITRPAAAGR